MPKRTNLFQDVVAIVHEILNPGVDVKRSVMVEHDQIGDPREIDLRMILPSPDGAITVGVEARSHGRKATQEWVEQQKEKHSHLGTTQLVLVSDTGFYEPAERLAKANQILTVTPTDLQEGSVRAQIVGRLPTLYPRTLELGVDLFAVVIDVDDCAEAIPIPVDPTVTLRLEDGRPVGTVRAVTERLMDARNGKVIDDAGLLRGQDSRSATTVLPFPGPRAIDDSGAEVEMWVDLKRWGKPWPSPVRAILARTSYHLSVGDGIALRHRTIAGVDVAYGESKAFDETFSVIASISDGIERFSVEVRNRSGANQQSLHEMYSAFPQALDSDL